MSACVYCVVIRAALSRHVVLDWEVTAELGKAV